jgi:hypothetical protein
MRAIPYPIEAAMNTRFLNALIATTVAISASAVLGWHVPAAAQSAPAAQSTVERGVTVKVTPRRLTGPEWEFAVVLDTHSEELKDDLQNAAVLVVEGREIRPVAWQGPGAGGHHREGVLRFPSPGDNPGAVELRIRRAGEAAPRVFRWEGASLK